MDKKCIAIHGIGSEFNQFKGWSKIMASKLKGWDVEEMIWGDITESQQEEAFNRRFKRPNIWHPKDLLHYYLRKLMFDVVLDANTYPENRDAILKRLKKSVDRAVHEGYRNINITAHSLGGWIVYDFLNEYDEYRKFVNSVITIGSSIPFYKADNFHGWPDIPWVNIWCKDDVLSVPFMRPYILDILYDGDVPLLSNTVISHGDYLVNPKFAKLFAKTLERL